MKNNDIWIKAFDGGEPRSIERQLCILRDRSLALTIAVGDINPIDAQDLRDKASEINAAAQALRQEMLTVDIFLSGIEHGRA